MSGGFRHWILEEERISWTNAKAEIEQLFGRVDRTLQTVQTLITEVAKPRMPLKRRSARIEHLPAKIAKMSKEQSKPVNSVAEEALMSVDVEMESTP
ncbi:GL25103 [Drosophila persimilis]|uniref:GL25103 n=1 Tax=Drosophila persimilis TaxID=7234 RepID=B4GU70_DROPE|nr:GL25103 [Drosophila persimilis]